MNSFKIILLSSSFSGLTQRIYRELVLLGHTIEQHYDLDEVVLHRQLQTFQPDLLICPFLTQRIPEMVWRDYPCLIVHPGIEGDRGPSSLDWAIDRGEQEWGVTLLQAAAEMDAGDIWETKKFPLRVAGKTSVYKREVSEAAVSLVKQALKNITSGDFLPRPLDYSKASVTGKLNPLMRQGDRKIDWRRDSTQRILQKINAADTNPGVLDDINGVAVRLFGAEEEARLSGKPGKVIAQYKGAICRATIDGAIWIKQMKCETLEKVSPIKLPAGYIYQQLATTKQLAKLSSVEDSSSVEDIKILQVGDVSYVYFNFYNGAANTQQCLDLKSRLIALKDTSTKCIVFMGGEDFWCNGIHLNCIEEASSPAAESWRNINAIDDVVREIIDCPRQLTIAALRNNAGAGGAIMALACDKVIVREGVVLNPHYKSMGLFGSEYWTYLLPGRVGESCAKHLTNCCEPLLAVESVELGFADMQFSESWESYHQQLLRYCKELEKSCDFSRVLAQKALRRKQDEEIKPLAVYRQEELCEMKKIFDDPESWYHLARRRFVYKGKVPQELKENKVTESAPLEVVVNF